MSISWDLLGNHLLPFSIKLDKQGRFLSAGSRILKILQEDPKGRRFTDIFKFVYPQIDKGDFFFNGTGHIKVSTKNSVVLRGDYQETKEYVFLLFNPDVSSVEELLSIGLSLDDLPRRTVLDKYLFLQSSLSASLQENLLLIDSIQTEKKQLEETNLLLDQSIAAARATVFKFTDGEFRFLNSSEDMRRFGFLKGSSMPLKGLLAMTASKYSYVLSNFFRLDFFNEQQKTRIEFPVSSLHGEEVWLRADAHLSADESFLIGILIDINFEKEIEEAIRKSEVKRSRHFGLQVHDKLSTSLVGLRMLMESGGAERDMKLLLSQIIEYSRGIMNALNVDYFNDADKRSSFEEFIRNVGQIQGKEVEFSWHEEDYFTHDSTDYFIFQAFQEIIMMSLGRPILNEVIVSSSHNLCLILLKVEKMPTDQLRELKAFNKESQGVTSQVIINEVDKNKEHYEMAFTFNR